LEGDWPEAEPTVGRKPSHSKAESQSEKRGKERQGRKFVWRGGLGAWAEREKKRPKVKRNRMKHQQQCKRAWRKIYDIKEDCSVPEMSGLDPPNAQWAPGGHYMQKQQSPWKVGTGGKPAWEGTKSMAKKNLRAHH